MHVNNQEDLPQEKNKSLIMSNNFLIKKRAKGILFRWTYVVQDTSVQWHWRAKPSVPETGAEQREKAGGDETQVLDDALEAGSEPDLLTYCTMRGNFTDFQIRIPKI